MKLVVVRFEKDGARIYHGEAAAALAADPNSLVNPVFPVGVPPHLWKRQGNSIAVLDSEPALRPRKVHRPTMALGIALGTVIGFILGVVINGL